jgi:hypothetical protein
LKFSIEEDKDFAKFNDFKFCRQTNSSLALNKYAFLIRYQEIKDSGSHIHLQHKNGCTTRCTLEGKYVYLTWQTPGGSLASGCGCV